MALTVTTRIERTKALGRDDVIYNLIIYTILFYGILYLRDETRKATYSVLLTDFCQWLVDVQYMPTIGLIWFWHEYVQDMGYDYPIPEDVEAILVQVLPGAR